MGAERIESKGLTTARKQRIAKGDTVATPVKKKASRVQACGAWTCVCTQCGHLPTSDGNATKHTTMNPGHNVYEQTFGWQCAACLELYPSEAAALACCACIMPGCGGEVIAPWLPRCVKHHQESQAGTAVVDVGYW